MTNSVALADGDKLREQAIEALDFLFATNAEVDHVPDQSYLVGRDQWISTTISFIEKIGRDDVVIAAHYAGHRLRTDVTKRNIQALYSFEEVARFQYFCNLCWQCVRTGARFSNDPYAMQMIGA